MIAHALIALASLGAPDGPPTDEPSGRLEVVASFDGPMPTGVTVSKAGRIFVNFPRWGDRVEFTVAEVVKGEARAYPDAAINRLNPAKPGASLISVQSVVVDPKDRLWIVDTGSVEFGPTTPGGPKLVGVDLATNKVFKTIPFPAEVALPTSYLNDIRFDLRRGQGGFAFLTDSSGTGPNGIIVVELGTGRSWRKLDDHPSTKPEPTFRPIVEGRVVMERPANGPPKPVAIGSDGIAIGHDGARLYYCPLSSRKLYSVAVDALIDPKIPADRVAASVIDHGEKGASDGLESDAQGRLYLTEFEGNAILRRNVGGDFETIAHAPRMLWPDTLSLAADGYLYFTANQLHRQPKYQKGRDLRHKPYALFRVRVDGRPVQLK